MKPFLTLLAAPVVLSACVVAVPVPGPGGSDPSAGPDTCGAAAYQGYVGQQSPAITVPPGTDYRSYRTGDPVTMDFNENRINFEYDRQGVLVKVSCG
ncbi:I78 family peptidase inhibitor [Paracoccus sp. TK19116]|uniref:I78 family peptidase inhibitor n=1 Tax=Paracoccus albicereus TaxID=2922394 RepID=A0ABT1MRI5_9RHOB|nr:I78 family peptidase inhibitor [Paracoccus albicereus]MCQ0970918.1 I78 family peptidase inhibitor [Paracoccus albicereus]